MTKRKAWRLESRSWTSLEAATKQIIVFLSSFMRLFVIKLFLRCDEFFEEFLWITACHVENILNGGFYHLAAVRRICFLSQIENTSKSKKH